MSIKDYIHNLQQRPVHERKRIAVVATVIGFAVIFMIWIFSFNEMNKPDEQPVDQTSASLNDLKNNFQTGKDSIQNMMQQLPAETQGGGTGADGSAGNNLQNPVDNSNESNNNQNNQDKTSVPQLP